MVDSTISLLTLVQYNVGESREKAQLPFMHSLNAQDHHVIALQEPCFSRQTLNTAAVPNYTRVIHPVLGVKTCIYVSGILSSTTWQVVHTGINLCAIDIKTTDGTKRIINVYLPGRQGTSTVNRNIFSKLEELVTTGPPAIVVGDFNLWHPSWGGPTVLATCSIASEFKSLTENLELQLVLPPGTTTWRRGLRRSTIDLVYTATELVTRILQCTPKEEWVELADHIPILTQLDLAPAKNRCLRRNFKDADWEKISKTVEHQLTITEDRGCIVQRAQRLQNALVQATATHVPLARPSLQARRGWNAECRQLVLETRQARRRFTISQSPLDFITYRALSNRKQRIIRREETKAWRRYVAGATEDPKGLWKMAQ